MQLDLCKCKSPLWLSLASGTGDELVCTICQPELKLMSLAAKGCIDSKTAHSSHEAGVQAQRCLFLL